MFFVRLCEFFCAAILGTSRPTAQVYPLQCKVHRNQMKLLGHILPRQHNHPDRLSTFEPNDDSIPRKPSEPTQRRGRPWTVWIEEISAHDRTTAQPNQISDVPTRTEPSELV